jgi:putative Holliday junction resolvase
MSKGRAIRTALAFDWGLAHIGVATGQTATATATPLTHLTARDGVPDWGAVGRLLAEWRPDVVVVGLPTDLDGSEGVLAPRARKFGRRLAGRFGCTVEFQDERLTTREAYARTEAGDDPDELHAIAAQVILEDWLVEQTS